MEENLIIKLSLICTILGIILLVIISDKIELPSSEISSISEKEIGKNIKVIGKVNRVTEKNTITIIDLEDKTGIIQIVAFKPENLKLKKGGLIQVRGKVSLYESSTQIYADSIEIIN
ncbi:OB-fold nucleic acid binding domain-containing protein [Candidatus Woesearchaeota archaeon]|nr:OB-fold nucleic acid binding domain-containing protein [Candidatus Woesearchaeota archaeon]